MRALLNINSVLMFSAILLMGAPLLLYAENSGVTITHAEGAVQNTDYVMSADIDYQLSEKSIEALNNGVSLFWTYQFQVHEQRDYLWNKTVLDKSVRYGIQYHALLKMYRVRNISNSSDENFSTLQGALDRLSVLRNYPLIEKSEISEGNQYIASMKVTFERDALPLPLRPVAYMNPQWYLSSDWYTWPLKK